MAELIEPSSILDMSQSQLDDLISTIRERRNRVIKARSVAHHRSRNSGVLSLRPKLEKLALRLDKAIVKLNSDLTRAERLVSEVVAIRLELGDATPSELASELRGTHNDSHGGEGDDDDQVSGSGVGGNDHDDDNVSGSQERPDQGVT